MPHVHELLTWWNIAGSLLLGGAVLCITASAVATNHRRGYEPPPSF